MPPFKTSEAVLSLRYEQTQLYGLLQSLLAKLRLWRGKKCKCSNSSLSEERKLNEYSMFKGIYDVELHRSYKAKFQKILKGMRVDDSTVELPNENSDSEIQRWLTEIELFYGERKKKEFEQEKPFLLEYLQKLKEEINSGQYSYTIKSPLIIGGSGIIFKVTHRNIPNKELILKFNRPLAPEQLPVIDNQPTSMVETERQILPLLNHANIIQAVDAGRFDICSDHFRPLSFIVEPFIPDTQTLRNYAVSLALGDQTTVTPENIDCSMRHLVSALYQWVAALIHTHEKGYVYLDVKPDNTLVDKNGHLFLIDFGSTQKMDAQSELSCEVFVTRYYADPRLKDKFLDKSSSNRVRCGVKGKELTKNLDYYALGKSILELLSIISDKHKNDFPQRAFSFNSLFGNASFEWS